MRVFLQGLESPFRAARYHSLVIDQEGFPDSELEVTARTGDGTIMAVRHRRLPHIQVKLKQNRSLLKRSLPRTRDGIIMDVRCHLPHIQSAGRLCWHALGVLSPARKTLPLGR